MKLFVLLKMVPDTVEELTVAPDNKSLDPDLLRYKLSDPDEHALEQALLLKEKHGGTVTVAALDSPELDEVLYTALAKGADRAVKLSGVLENAQSLAAAKIFASFLKAESPSLSPETLVLVRSQSIDDLEGEVGAYLADLLGLPYACMVTGVTIENGAATVTKEFAGGLRGAFSLPLPAVLGIQSAEKPPRYAPIAKVRSMMKSGKVARKEMAPPKNPACFPVERMYKPDLKGRAQMLEGAPEEVANRIVEVLAKNNLT